MYNSLGKKIYFYLYASLPLMILVATIAVALISHTFIQYCFVLFLGCLTIYNIYLFGYNNPIHISFDDEKINIRYLFPKLSKTFYWKEILNIELCEKGYVQMYGARLPEMALIIKDKDQEVALWWHYYYKLNRIYLKWLELHPTIIKESVLSNEFSYQIFKKPLWTLFNFYLVIIFSCFFIFFTYECLSVFPVFALIMGPFCFICIYYGLSQHLFYLEWDAHHLSVKNDLLPFCGYSVTWENIGVIKFTTLYGDKSLWLANQSYNLKEYRIEAVPDKAIKEICREMKRNGIPIKNEMDS